MNNETATLHQLLTENWRDLTYIGDDIDGYVTIDRVNGRTTRWMQEIHVITRTPSGQHLQWTYAEGLTEIQECMGPHEWHGQRLTPVQKIEKTVTVTRWVKI